MAAKPHDAIVESEKTARQYNEKAELESIKPVAGGNVDYTGSVAKTDPREIALVRKIDWRLMVRKTSPMIDEANRIAHAVYDVFPRKCPSTLDLHELDGQEASRPRKLRQESFLPLLSRSPQSLTTSRTTSTAMQLRKRASTISSVTLA